MFYRIVKETHATSSDIYQTDNFALIGVEFYQMILEIEGRDYMGASEFERYVEHGYVINSETYRVDAFEKPEDANTILVKIGDTIYGSTTWAGFYKLAYYHKDVRAFVAGVDVTPEMENEEYY